MKKFGITPAAVITLALLAGRLHAESDLGIHGVGGNIGLVDIEAGSTIGFGGLIDLGYVADNVRLEANLDYWSKSWDYSFYSETLEWSLSDVVIGGTVKYELGDEDASARWYVGGGLGMHLLSWDVTSTGAYSDEEDSASESRIGIDVLGGVNLGGSESRSYFGEIRYRTVSDWTQTCFRAGVKFALGD